MSTSKSLVELAKKNGNRVGDVKFADTFGFLQPFNRLLKSYVFTQNFLDIWISAKRKEQEVIWLRPLPNDFFLYQDV